ncbi:MAG: response regulator transcription factor [Ardenticatenaceae bacterium]|nr:response regulator transcription factor [Anaerolineales bacterium]MCB8982966.1 response regulator transcription factor [Ardenticatenaceae bacterium]MCB8986422.1 response regulator transcription factor [Ardenticatenaceae bacterium]
MQALLVVSNPDERDILSFILKHAGLSVADGRDLHNVTAKWLERPADLIVVAGKDGRQLQNDLVELRSVTQVPCLVIIENPTEDDFCQTLHAGADLVLARPVSPRILHEYVLAFLRRARTVPASVLPPLDVSEVKLDPDTRTVVVLGQKPRRLTQLEFRLLYVLMVNREQVVPVDMIVERVWGFTGQGSRELVRGLVSRLRRKIEPDLLSPRFIQNVPGVGYRFTLEDM